MEIALRTLKLSHLFYSTISQGKRLFGEFENIPLINFCLNCKRLRGGGLLGSFESIIG